MDSYNDHVRQLRLVVSLQDENIGVKGVVSCPESHIQWNIELRVTPSLLSPVLGHQHYIAYVLLVSQEHIVIPRNKN